jgi:YtkA-like
MIPLDASPRSAFAVAALVAGALCGCTTSSASPGAPGDVADASNEATVTCQNDTRVDTYVANLAKASTSGSLKVTLVSSDPAPPSVGTNTWTIHVADAAGAPMSNAPISIASFMPDHGHGSSVKAVITPQADGNYSVTTLYLFMPGVWRVTFALPATDAAPAEQVEFFFCIAG